MPSETCCYLGCEELANWLYWQLESWNSWAATRDPGWLALPTGNSGFPDLRIMLAHAFTPLHRYSDQALGVDPIAPPDMSAASWHELYGWGATCLKRYAQAVLAVSTAAPEAIVNFQTRSAGVLHVKARLALAHAATHCFWHLGGVAHLLRQAGLEPPQRSDLIFWAREEA